MHRYENLAIRGIKEQMEYLKIKRETVVSMHNKEPHSVDLSAFDTKIFYPQRRALREECGKHGHDFNHDATLNTDRLVCFGCGMTTRRDTHDIS